MAGHAQLKFVMMECSKTQIRLMRHIYKVRTAEDESTVKILKVRTFAVNIQN